MQNSMKLHIEMNLYEFENKFKQHNCHEIGIEKKIKNNH